MQAGFRLAVPTDHPEPVFSSAPDTQGLGPRENDMEHRNTSDTGMAGRGNPGPMSTVHLKRLDDLDDYKVADGDPDIRGWSVFAADGRRVGEVDSLIVDTQAMQVRYLDLDLDRESLDLTEDRHVLVPISGARLDDDDDGVHLTGLTSEELAAMPPYRHGEPIAAADARDHVADPRRS